MNNQLIAVIFSAILAGILLTYLKVRLSKKTSWRFFVKSLDDGELIGLCKDLPLSGPKREALLRALLLEAVVSRKSQEDFPFGILLRKDVFNMTCSKEIMRKIAERIIWSIKKGVFPEINELEALFSVYQGIHFSKLEEDLLDEIVWSLAKVLAEKVKDYGTWKVFFKNKGVVAKAALGAEETIKCASYVVQSQNHLAISLIYLCSFFHSFVILI